MPHNGLLSLCGKYFLKAFALQIAIYLWIDFIHRITLISTDKVFQFRKHWVNKIHIQNLSMEYEQRHKSQNVPNIFFKKGKLYLKSNTGKRGP